MKNTILLTLLSSCLMTSAQTPSIQHRFLTGDFWLGQIHYVDQTNPSMNWSMPWGGGTRDLQLIGNNLLMVSCNDGYQVYDLVSRTRVTEFHNRLLNGTTTARRRADGSTWIGANQGTNICIFALNTTNGIIRSITLGHLKALRMMRFTADNTLMLSENDGATEISIMPDVPEAQRIVRRFQLPRSRNAYMALKAADGTCWVAGGYAQGLFQYKPDGTLLREFKAAQPEGFSNWFYAGFQMLKNGHIVQANWTGHGAKDFKEGWKLIEFDADGKVVWHWHVPKEQAGTINGILVLDDLDTTVFNDDETGILGRKP